MSSTPRQLIIFCDGTNNTLTANDHDTNVLRTFELLARNANSQQILYYDPGVGAPDALPSTGLDEWFRNKCDRLWGLASGRGIYENISQAYLFLMKNYQPGDQIYLFGFSRGAFTVRCLSGMVHLFGIIDIHHEAMLPTLLRVYFSGKGDSKLFHAVNTLSVNMKALFGIEVPQEIKKRGDVAEQIRLGFAHNSRNNAAIHFVGVWDTVESVGVPGFSVSISSSPSILNKRIRHVRHALALDEHRSQFQPRLYEQNDFGEASQSQSLRQLWFRGNHCDVGGGYAQNSDTALSGQSWQWMLEEAKQCGLIAEAHTDSSHQVTWVHDETCSMPWWALLGLSHRKTTGLQATDQTGAAAVMLKLQGYSESRALKFPQHSIWSEARKKTSLFMATAGCIFFSLLYGAFMENFTPGTGSTVQEIWQQAQNAWQQNLAVSQAQLLAVLHPQQLADYKNAAHPYVALFLVDTGLIASYGFLLSRLMSWGFAHRVGFTRIGLNDKFANLAGRLLPLLICADLLENVATSLALHSDSIFLYFCLSFLTAAKFFLFVLTIVAGIGLRLFKQQ